MNLELFEQLADLESRHWWFVGRRRLVAAVCDALLGSRVGVRLLDVGCGTGANLAALAARPGRRALGIDPQPQAIELARRRFPELEFVCGHAPEGVPGGLQGFDLVTLLDVLEHVPDDAGLLGRVVAGLRPGAQLLLTVPADPRLWGPHDVSHGHLRRYEPGTLRALWRALPVRERLLAPINTTLYPLVRLLRAWTRLRGAALGERGTDLFLPPGPVNALLAAVFAAERRGLLTALADGRGRRPGPGRGVSLLAVLAVEGLP